MPARVRPRVHAQSFQDGDRATAKPAGVTLSCPYGVFMVLLLRSSIYRGTRSILLRSNIYCCSLWTECFLCWCRQIHPGDMAPSLFVQRIVRETYNLVAISYLEVFKYGYGCL